MWTRLTRRSSMASLCAILVTVATPRLRRRSVGRQANPAVPPCAPGFLSPRVLTFHALQFQGRDGLQDHVLFASPALAPANAVGYLVPVSVWFAGMPLACSNHFSVIHLSLLVHVTPEVPSYVGDGRYDRHARDHLHDPRIRGPYTECYHVYRRRRNGRVSYLKQSPAPRYIRPGGSPGSPDRSMRPPRPAPRGSEPYPGHSGLPR